MEHPYKILYLDKILKIWSNPYLYWYNETHIVSYRTTLQQIHY